MAGGAAGAGEVAGGGVEGVKGGGGGKPAAAACCWATKVVDAAGHPTPGPLKFCRVMMAASIRVEAD